MPRKLWMWYAYMTFLIVSPVLILVYGFECLSMFLFGDILTLNVYYGKVLLKNNTYRENHSFTSNAMPRFTYIQYFKL